MQLLLEQESATKNNFTSPVSNMSEANLEECIKNGTNHEESNKSLNVEEQLNKITEIRDFNVSKSIDKIVSDSPDSDKETMKIDTCIHKTQIENCDNTKNPTKIDANILENQNAVPGKGILKTVDTQDENAIIQIENKNSDSDKENIIIDNLTVLEEHNENKILTSPDQTVDDNPTKSSQEDDNKRSNNQNDEINKNEEININEETNKNEEINKHEEININEDININEEINKNEELKKSENININGEMNKNEEFDKNEDININEEINKNEDINKNKELNKNEEFNKNEDINKNKELKENEEANKNEVIVTAEEPKEMENKTVSDDQVPTLSEYTKDDNKLDIKDIQTHSETIANADDKSININEDSTEDLKQDNPIKIDDLKANSSDKEPGGLINTIGVKNIDNSIQMDDKDDDNIITNEESTVLNESINAIIGEANTCVEESSPNESLTTEVISDKIQNTSDEPMEIDEDNDIKNSSNNTLNCSENNSTILQIPETTNSDKNDMNKQKTKNTFSPISTLSNNLNIFS